MKKRIIAALFTVLTIQSAAVPAINAVSVSETAQMVYAVQTAASLSANKVSIGGSVKVTAVPKASEGCTYAVYYRLQGREVWSCAKSYSKETTAVIKPLNVGKYDVCVKTKEVNGKITKEYLSFESVDDLALNVKMSDSQIVLGTGTTITASANGGNGGYLYGVYWKKKTDTKWITALKDSKTCNVKITPIKAGEYDICVKVRDKTDRIKKQYFTFKTNDFGVEANLLNDQITLGQKETISAYITNDSVSCRFAFYYRKKGSSNWKLIQSYQENDSVRVLPKESGIYEVCVKAQNTAGSIRKAYADFKVNDTLKVSQTLSAKSIKTGDSVIVVLLSTGGTGKKEFAVYYATKESYDAQKPVWKTALTYGQQGNAVITPDKTGEYVVVTKARDEAGSMAKTEYVYFSVSEKPDEETLEVKGSFRNQQSTVYLHTAAVFTASASGGSGEYTYALQFREKGTDIWKLLRDYSSEPKFELNRAAMGSYTLTTKNNFELMIIVRDSKGKTAQTIYPFTVTDSDQYELPIVPIN